MYKHPIAIALLLAASPSALPSESFPAYRAHEDTVPGDWRALNERMRALGGHRGHVQDAQDENRGPAPAAAAPHVRGSTGSPAPAAPAASQPAPGATRSMHGHMHGHGQPPAHGHRHSHKEKP